MCNPTESNPSPRAALDNLRQPMPLGRKLSLLIRNNWIKVRHGQDCCGHAGEPGC